MSEEAMAAEPAAEKHFTFAGHESDNPLDMLDDCRGVVDMLCLALSELTIEGENSRGFVVVLRRLETSLADIEAIVQSSISEPYLKGLNKGRTEARGEYQRGVREGMAAAERNRHAD